MTLSPSDRSFDYLVAEACSAPIRGWDFSFLDGRIERTSLPWDYPSLAADIVGYANRVCDVDTGGGELFGSLRPPWSSVAVEPHPPNLAVASAHLTPMGVTVVPRTEESLPIENEAVDLVLNSHGYLNLSEAHRVLSPGGWLLTQQVGSRNDAEFNEVLSIPAAPHPAAINSVEEIEADLQTAGFEIHDAREARVKVRYLDIGAVVFQLRMVPWQAPGFDVTAHRQQLQRIHQQILAEGAFTVCSQRFLIRGRKPSA